MYSRNFLARFVSGLSRSKLSSKSSIVDRSRLMFTRGVKGVRAFVLNGREREDECTVIVRFCFLGTSSSKIAIEYCNFLKVHYYLVLAEL